MTAPMKPEWLLLPLLFAVSWTAVAFAVSRQGWAQFARRHPASVRPAGPSFHCPIVWFRSVLGTYNNCVRIVFCPSGIYVRPFFVIGLFHAPFLIPWEKVAAVPVQRKFRGALQLDVRDGDLELHLGLGDPAAREFERLRRA